MKIILVDAVNAFVVPGEGIFSGMHQLLEKYPNKKIILTGANEQQRGEFGLNDMPYEVFSLNHNPEKTDPEYYRKMLSHFGLDADDVLYFEHNEDAVRSARSVGITTYHYDKDARDIKKLKKFIDKNVSI